MYTLIFILKFGLALVGLALVPVMIFLERKGAAVIQDRPGPNRAALKIPGIGNIRGFGMVHNFTDAVKLFFKEDFIPARAHKWFYLVAPAIPVVTAVLTPAVIPWFADVTFEFAEGTRTITGSVITNNSSLLLLFAMGALSVYGVVLGSWGSNSKYSLLGGLRSSAMMISYEVAMGLSVLGLVLIVGSFNLAEIVNWQAENAWGILVQPVAFFLFVTAMFAETGRTPFDVAEGESEIVGGFHTEYSAIKFALFFMGEYAHIVVASALIATVFCGGWHLPFLGTDAMQTEIGIGYVLAGFAVIKGLVLLFLASLVAKQKKRYAGFNASDAASKSKEYGIFTGLFGLGALACLAAAGAAVWAQGQGFLAKDTGWCELLTVWVQIGIVLMKTLFFCWLFVWVRWTVPRLRYDHIMGLGWKVMLNIALINLLITAIVVKALGVGS